MIRGGISPVERCNWGLIGAPGSSVRLADDISLVKGPVNGV